MLLLKPAPSNIAHFARQFHVFLASCQILSRASGHYLKLPTGRVALAQSLILSADYILKMAPSIKMVQGVTDALVQINCLCRHLAIELPV